MTPPHAVVVDARLYEPIRLTEDRLEGLLRTAAGAVFPGFRFFDFKPAIRGAEGTRHPDGVLIAEGHPEWWVVEVETHLHSVDEHIEPQLRDLASGFYGPDAYRYLERNDLFDGARYCVDWYEPSFLLVIDSLTAEVQRAAARTGFTALECSVFRSEENRYAIALAGNRPAVASAGPRPGLDFRLKEIEGLALLSPLDGKPVPQLKSDVMVVGSSEESVRLTEGRTGIVLTLTPAEVRDALGGNDRYRLLMNGHLEAVVPTSIATPGGIDGTE